MKFRQRAFTLLELMVAIGIFAVMSLMAYGGLDSVLNTRRAVEQRLDRIAELQKAYMRLRADFQEVRDRSVRDAFGSASPAMVLHSSPVALEFTRGGWRNPVFHPRSSQERLAYRIVDRKLIRASWRVLDRVQGDEPAEVPVLDGVDEISWRFLDDQREWQLSWPPPTQAGQPVLRLPLAVEMTLHTRDWSDVKLLFPLGLN